MTDVKPDLSALPQMTTNELCQRYLELFGQPVRTRHKAYLIRKIAWRMQALAEGDLSERARKRAMELANDADVRVMPPKIDAAQGGSRNERVSRVVPLPAATDPRLRAPPGAAIVRQYKGRPIRVIVANEGFEYEGQRFKTLTAVAEKVTGPRRTGSACLRDAATHDADHEPEPFNARHLGGTSDSGTNGSGTRSHPRADAKARRRASSVVRTTQVVAEHPRRNIAYRACKHSATPSRSNL